MASLLRIGVLSQQTGVSPDVLRVWERRYGLLQPTRTEGGFRLYSEADAERVREMQQLIARGMRAGDAARQVLAPGQAPEAREAAGPPLEATSGRLWSALISFDEAELQSVLDDILGHYTLDTAIRDVLIPALHHLGREWEEGVVSVGQEHFAVQVIRARLMALARGWDRGFGPRVLLACPDGELHDLSLAMFGLAMNRRGWRVTFLGANTPISTLDSVADALQPELVVLYAADWDAYEPLATDIGALAGRWPLAVAGEGAPRFAERTAAQSLEGDPVTSAELLTRGRAGAGGAAGGH